MLRMPRRFTEVYCAGDVVTDQQPDNLVLEHLRYLRASIDGLRTDVQELKERQTAVELGLVGLRRELVSVAETVAHTNARIDRLTTRIERIERRLDLVGSERG
jgi:ubiquinone biosynthesis protein UbiJ